MESKNAAFIPVSTSQGTMYHVVAKHDLAKDWLTKRIGTPDPVYRCWVLDTDRAMLGDLIRRLDREMS